MRRTEKEPSGMGKGDFPPLPDGSVAALSMSCNFIGINLAGEILGADFRKDVIIRALSKVLFIQVLRTLHAACSPYF